MSSNQKVVLRYWDACVFISILKGDHKTHKDILSELRNEAKLGNMKIVTSTLTLAEVVKPRQCDGRQLTQSERRLVEDSFKDNNIILLDVTQKITVRSREIQWGTNVKPVDAIHLATAEYAKVDFFDTFDAKYALNNLNDFSWIHPFVIGPPQKMQVEIPLS